MPFNDDDDNFGPEVLTLERRTEKILDYARAERSRTSLSPEKSIVIGEHDPIAWCWNVLSPEHQAEFGPFDNELQRAMIERLGVLRKDCNAEERKAYIAALDAALRQIT